MYENRKTIQTSLFIQTFSILKINLVPFFHKIGGEHYPLPFRRFPIFPLPLPSTPSFNKILNQQQNNKLNIHWQINQRQNKPFGKNFSG